jgi:AraC-like DNA-binding protein
MVMGGAATRHDRDAGPPDQATAADHELSSSVLRTALERLRLEGAVFLRAEYREPWAYESLTAPETAKILRPDAERVILFHVVASGTCWVEVDAGERHWARAGDVIVLPYGDQHRMGGIDEATCVSISTFLDLPPWRQMPVIRYGADGALTDVVCGYLHSSDPLFDPDLRVFPSAFVVRPPAGPAADWVRANITYALEQSEPQPSSPGIVMSRLPELLLVEVLRLHLASAPAADHGWLAALNDPVLRPAMALLHNAPEQRWTVAGLARQAMVSRSVLDERFREVLGRSPIRYLTDWRMHLAEDLLATTDLGIGAIAHRIGYDAEEAFSRAFKRSHGIAPSAWRATHPLR